MVPAAANKQTANELFALLLYYVPKPFRSFAQDCVGVLMGQRLRSQDSHDGSCPVSPATIRIYFRCLVHVTFPRADS